MNTNAPPSSPLSASMMMQSPFRFKTCPSSQFSPSEDNRLLRPQTQTETQTQTQVQVQTETDVGEFSNSLLTQIPRSLGSVSEDIPWDACSDFPYFNTKKDQDDDSSSFSSDSDTSLSSSPGVGETGAQSPYLGPLESLSSLVASLPIKKGLSQFYGGKSQSFSCLSEARLLSDLAKPENPYAKRRRSFASFAAISDNHRFHTNINKYNDDNDNDDDNNKNNTITINSNHNNNNNNKRAFATSTSDSTNLWKSCSAPARTFSLSDKLA